ncbi:MAG: fused MFS/spermidine synthase, partial [Proteobacteria bacterium]|nr:fused MFS/spermidine synthase [Pseudomonadota bacterium]
LAAAALATLPISAAGAALPDPRANPTPWLLVLLVGAVGPTFAVASATAPMVQRWFAASGHVAGADPYFLYAASNLGSMAALIGYPAVIEPQLSLTAQSLFWTAGFVVLALLTAACGALAGNRQQSSPSAAAIAERPAAGERVRWILLSFAPSSLLIGVTTHITTDIASAPLLWVVPLVIYLLTFVLVFARRNLIPHWLLLALQPVFVVPIAMADFLKVSGGQFFILLLHLVAFFVTAMICHGELARSRPAARRLTEFYLFMSLGGVLGGLFAALLAPAIFTTIVEYPLALVLACLLRPKMGAGRIDTLRERRDDLVWPLVFFVILAGAAFIFRDAFIDMPLGGRVVVAAVVTPFGCMLALRPVRFGLGIAAIFVAGALATGPHGEILERERNFFGVLRVNQSLAAGTHVLVHNTTVHGVQSLDPARRLEPQSYYHPSGPLGDVFAAFAPVIDSRPVAAVGLGAGSLACYGRAGQSLTFYEINPANERIARDRRYFTFLSDCPPRTEVVLGDARLTLAAAPAAHYAALVLDAFSSDSIPLHLITREAMRLYFSKLAPGGIIAVHISNRFLELRPVLGNMAADLGLASLTRLDPIKLDEPGLAKYPSVWVVLARREADLAPLAGRPGWTAMPVYPAAGVWTDDFSNIVTALLWHLRGVGDATR